MRTSRKKRCFLDDDTQETRQKCATYFCWPDFDVEITSLIGNLQNFWPSEAVDPESIFVNEQPVSTHPQHDIHTFRVLPRRGQRHTSQFSYLPRKLSPLTYPEGIKQLGLVSHSNREDPDKEILQPEVDKCINFTGKVLDLK